MTTPRSAGKPASAPIAAHGLFVTGTDTGAGKTLISAAIVRALVLRGLRVGVYKPAETGCRERGGAGDAADLRAGGTSSLDTAADHGVDDAASPSRAADLHGAAAGLLGEDGELLATAAGREPPSRGGAAVSSYLLRRPAAPLVAAEAEGISIDPARLVADFERISAANDFVLVEGAGGLLVPLAAGFTYRDLACRLGLTVLCVVGSRLGCINHALLTFEAIDAAGLSPFGYVINQLSGDDAAELDARSNRAAIARFTTAGNARDLGLFPFVAESQRADLDALARLAEACLDLDALTSPAARA